MELGAIVNLPLRDVWSGEATHFTPWLAQNLDVLAQKLGMDLELESTEASAGDFSADIIARDLSTNHLVVIENQFGNTDHRHLGQLITYSSVLGAGVVVWIAESIRSEHKSAIDFLNQNLKESLRLYALEASVIRIDNSKPAFVLSVVSRPTEVAATTPEGAQPISETRERYREYFQALIDELREKHHFTNARAGQPQNWYTFASDNSRIYKYGTSFANGDRVRVETYLDCGDKGKNERLFDCLYSQKEEIENEFGSTLSWERLDEKRACRIATYHDGGIDADSEELLKIQQWAILSMLKFKSVFPARIEKCLKQIDSSEPPISYA
ncbi:DUF4268 domain-containing protein [Tardiphaga sp. vice352]|nr:DUF4268 domain-containing protein [Tardiphaga sp. vice278]QDM24437.1 DUF4268 domain-containing protein [Tardiphaga sp. vice154]QDM29650.1 DUF4268 domain-containing protein [Tardiphaga sp. vice304]QDM34744.1 DUF4268 domain-containing protein [Tardiphaga sp. vice352]